MEGGGIGPGKRNARDIPRRNCNAVIGYSYLPTAVNDHSRLAYCEILADQRKDTAAALWRRARAWFTVAGITVERVMTGKRSLLTGPSPGAMPSAAAITHKRIRPYRPQTNGQARDCPGLS